MKIAGLITEYNPFTAGHAWHLRRAKDTAGADFCIAVMSGDYVQRGEPAVFSKHDRAGMALAAGVDVVLELPLDTSTGSAEFFAMGAVSLLDALGCVDVLVFGSECGDTAPFLKLAPLLAREDAQLQTFLRQGLKKGLSFPAARAQSLSRLLGGSLPGDCQGLLDSPNNILGLEYCKALERLKSPITPVALKRQGAGYHEEALSAESFSSASALRRLLREVAGLGLSKEAQPKPELSLKLAGQVPSGLLPLYQKLLKQGGPIFPEDFSLLLFARLLERSQKELENIWDLSPELASRISRLAPGFSGWSSFVQSLKTRDLTQTRVQRALLHLLLGLRGWQPPAYARLLGFRREAAPLLSRIKEKSRIPLLSKAADAEAVLSPQALLQFEKTSAASQLYQAVYSQKYHLPFVHEFQKQIVIF